MRFQDWTMFAAHTLARPNPDEANIRRAVSAMYYGLFHRLADDGSALFRPGGNATVAQVARAFTHTLMRKVCQAYSGAGMPPKPLDSLVALPLDPALNTVARTFVRLQEAREAADYDMGDRRFTPQYGMALLEQYVVAQHSWDGVRHQPQATTFLTALLLHDKWTRRG